MPHTDPGASLRARLEARRRERQQAIVPDAQIPSAMAAARAASALASGFPRDVSQVQLPPSPVPEHVEGRALNVPWTTTPTPADRAALADARRLESLQRQRDQLATRPTTYARGGIGPVGLGFGEGLSRAVAPPMAASAALTNPAAAYQLYRIARQLRDLELAGHRGAGVPEPAGPIGRVLGAETSFESGQAAGALVGTVPYFAGGGVVGKKAADWATRLMTRVGIPGTQQAARLGVRGLGPGLVRGAVQGPIEFGLGSGGEAAATAAFAGAAPEEVLREGYEATVHGATSPLVALPVAGAVGRALKAKTALRELVRAGQQARTTRMVRELVPGATALPPERKPSRVDRAMESVLASSPVAAARANLPELAAGAALGARGYAQGDTPEEKLSGALAGATIGSAGVASLRRGGRGRLRSGPLIESPERKWVSRAREFLKELKPEQSLSVRQMFNLTSKGTFGRTEWTRVFEPQLAGVDPNTMFTRDQWLEMYERRKPNFGEAIYGKSPFQIDLPARRAELETARDALYGELDVERKKLLDLIQAIPDEQVRPVGRWGVQEDAPLTQQDRIDWRHRVREAAEVYPARQDLLLLFRGPVPDNVLGAVEAYRQAWERVQPQLREIEQGELHDFQHRTTGMFGPLGTKSGFRVVLPGIKPDTYAERVFYSVPRPGVPVPRGAMASNPRYSQHARHPTIQGWTRFGEMELNLPEGWSRTLASQENQGDLLQYRRDHRVVPDATGGRWLVQRNVGGQQQDWQTVGTFDTEAEAQAKMDDVAPPTPLGKSEEMLGLLSMAEIEEAMARGIDVISWPTSSTAHGIQYHTRTEPPDRLVVTRLAPVPNAKGEVPKNKQGEIVRDARSLQLVAHREGYPLVTMTLRDTELGNYLGDDVLAEKLLAQIPPDIVGQTAAITAKEYYPDEWRDFNRLGNYSSTRGMMTNYDVQKVREMRERIKLIARMAGITLSETDLPIRRAEVRTSGGLPGQGGVSTAEYVRQPRPAPPGPPTLPPLEPPALDVIRNPGGSMRVHDEFYNLLHRRTKRLARPEVRNFLMGLRDALDAMEPYEYNRNVTPELLETAIAVRTEAEIGRQMRHLQQAARPPRPPWTQFLDKAAKELGIELRQASETIWEELAHLRDAEWLSVGNKPQLVESIERLHAEGRLSEEATQMLKKATDYLPWRQDRVSGAEFRYAVDDQWRQRRQRIADDAWQNWDREHPDAPLETFREQATQQVQSVVQEARKVLSEPYQPPAPPPEPERPAPPPPEQMWYVRIPKPLMDAYREGKVRFPEMGAASTEALGTLAGGGVGAAVGAAADEENRWRGALLGGAAGAGLGFFGTRGLRRGKPPAAEPPMLRDAATFTPARPEPPIQARVQPPEAVVGEVPATVGRITGADIAESQPSAVRTPDGRVFRGDNHGDALNRAVEAGALTPDAELGKDYEQGFVRRDGQFDPRPSTALGEPTTFGELAARGERKAPPGPIDVNDYVNLAKFDVDPSGAQRLSAEVERLVRAEGLHPKERVPWSRTREIASQLGLDVTDETLGSVNRRLTGPEMLAIRNIISANIAAGERLYQQRAKLPERSEPVAEIDRLITAIEKQNARLLDRFIQARSQTGRDLNNLKIVANRTLDPTVWLSTAQKIARRDLTASEITTISQLVETRDRAKLVQFVHGLRRATPWEKTVTLWKAGLLTNPKTHVVNITSNTTMSALEAVKDPVAALADRLLSMASGVRTKGGWSRGMLDASGRGAVEGLREAGDVLRGVPTARSLAKLDLPRETNYDNAFLDTYTKTVFRLLGAQDRVFLWSAYRRSLHEQATLAGRQQGLRGEKLRQYVEDVQQGKGLLSDEMQVQAMADAEIATFRNETMLGKFASRIGAPEVDVKIRGYQRKLFNPFTFALPFTRTPSAVATSVLKYSPAGLAKAGVWDLPRFLTAVAQGKSHLGGVPVKVLQRELAESVGRGTVGSAAIYLGWVLAGEDKATGAAPTSGTQERQQWMQENRQPNSVKVGDNWYNAGRISPVGNLIALGANLRRVWDPQFGPKTPSERLAELSFSAARTVADQPFLTGVSGAMAALQEPEREGARFVQGLQASAVPAIVGAVARGTDPTARMREGMLGPIQERIPGWRESLPPQRTAFGDPVQRAPEGNVAERLVEALFNPFSAARDIRERDPLVRTLAEIGYGVPRLRRIQGESADAYSARAAEDGRELRRELEAMVSDAEFQQLSKEEQVDEVARRVATMRRQQRQAREEP